MSEDFKELARQIAQEEIADFSLRVLRYDIEQPGDDPKPWELFEWVKQQQVRSDRLRRRLGAGVLAVLGGAGTVFFSLVVPWLARLLGL